MTGCMTELTNALTHRRMHAWMNEQMTQGTSESMGKWTSGQMHEC